MKFDDIIGEKEELEDKISRGIDKEIIEFVKEEAKKDKDDCVCYNGLRLGTPKEIKELIDVSFEVLAKLKKYKKRFGEI